MEGIHQPFCDATDQWSDSWGERSRSFQKDWYHAFAVTSLPRCISQSLAGRPRSQRHKIWLRKSKVSAEWIRGREGCGKKKQKQYINKQDLWVNITLTPSSHSDMSLKRFLKVTDSTKETFGLYVNGWHTCQDSGSNWSHDAHQQDAYRHEPTIFVMSEGEEGQ